MPSQAVRDAVLWFLERNVLPEVLVLFLHEKGNVPAADSIELKSRKGFTTMRVSWRAIKLWELPAEDLLALGDVALLPWVPLAKLSGPPEPIVSQCKARIDHEVPSPDREDLLTVAQFLLKLRYNDEAVLKKLRDLLGGREAMIQSPLYQEFVEEAEARGRDRGDAEGDPQGPRPSPRPGCERSGGGLGGRRVRSTGRPDRLRRGMPNPG